MTQHLKKEAQKYYFKLTFYYLGNNIPYTPHTISTNPSKPYNMRAPFSPSHLIHIDAPFDLKNHLALNTAARKDNDPRIMNMQNRSISDVLMSFYYFISTARVPSSLSEIKTFTTSPGNKSSIFSGHSIKHNAPL
jgi:hypothetical protein